MDKEYIVEKLATLSNGNPGAISVITQILSTYPLPVADTVFKKMVQDGIVDYHIWVLYKEKNKDIHSFVNHFLT